MKNWKEVPHLFANGRFQIKPLDGYEYTLTGKVSDWLEKRKEWRKTVKLIARPISDMSDDERQIYEKLSWSDYEIDPENMYYGSPDSFLYLLKIGVLPPDFDETDVIWRYENE